jgi:tetratricopeptide (TPR) repeat protein
MNASPGISPIPTVGSGPSNGASVPPPAGETAPAFEPEATPQNDTGEGDSLGSGTGSGALQNDQGTAPQEPDSSTGATSPPPALDASAMTLAPELGNQSLGPEIAQAVAPALAASLRLTESARKQLIDGRVDDAMRDLTRAVSLDPADAFAYYYLGRAYLARNNYAQALTFLRRAEIGFNGRPDWTAEALSYEGLCDEELGDTSEAAEAYKRALAASPSNFRARVGYGRLASVVGPVEDVNAPPPSQDLAISPPAAPDESAPLEQPPPPPPE